MEAYKLLIAVALLNAPELDKQPDDSDLLWSEIGTTLQQVAVHNEILDKRETRFMLVDPYHFLGDVVELRKRTVELSTAPRVGESEMFPSRKIAADFLSVNRSYQNELKMRLLLDRVNQYEIKSALEETARLYSLWERVHESRRKFYYISVRRRALMELQNLIGEKAFRSGNVPPPIPLGRLPRMIQK